LRGKRANYAGIDGLRGDAVFCQKVFEELAVNHLQIAPPTGDFRSASCIPYFEVLPSDKTKLATKIL
jgi:hypothetical protein